MRKEHRYHVVLVSFMMLVVLAVFVFVIINRPEGAGAGITTSLPPVEVQPVQPGEVQITVEQPSSNIGTYILLGLLILLALLFILYVGIKIAKELKHTQNK
jgi:uncharacterized integral membrane protein